MATPRTLKKPAKLIPTAGPSITEREVSYVTDAICHCQDERCYEYIGRLEKHVASYVGVPYAIATSSCTGALHLALWGLGIGPGDEVIVPDMTWVASVAPVIYVGATPVFVDIKEDTWCIDPEAITQAITKKTKAIIVVHTYGHPADMDAISAIAKAHKLAVIEDAAPSLGSLYKGRKTGGLGDIGAFSFHGSKIAASGEGGILMLSDPELYLRIRVIANHGRDGSRLLTAKEWGIKYNMSNLQAAFALAQVERIEELVSKKRQNYAWYLEELSGIEGIQMSFEHPDVFWNCWQTSIVLREGLRISQDECMARLKEANIDSRPFFPPVSSLPMVRQNLSRRNPVSYFMGSHGINLPSRHDLTQEQVAYSGEVLREIIR